MRVYLAKVESRVHRVAVEGNGAGTHIRIDDCAVAAAHAWLDESGQNLLVLLDGRSYDLRIEEAAGRLVLTHAGHRYQATVVDEHLAALKQRAGTSGRLAERTIVSAPMPGLVVRVLVAPGDEVAGGARLVVLEAMKMENDIKAPRSGRIAAVPVGAGQPVEAGAELVVME